MRLGSINSNDSVPKNESAESTPASIVTINFNDFVNVSQFIFPSQSENMTINAENLASFNGKRVTFIIENTGALPHTVTFIDGFIGVPVLTGTVGRTSVVMCEVINGSLVQLARTTGLQLVL